MVGEGRDPAATLCDLSVKVRCDLIGGPAARLLLRTKIMSPAARRYALQTLLHGRPDPLLRSLGGSVSFYAALSTPGVLHPALLRLMRLHPAFWKTVESRRWSVHAWSVIRAGALADGGHHAVHAFAAEQLRGTSVKRLLASLPAALLRALYADSRTWPELEVVRQDRRLHRLVTLEQRFNAAPGGRPHDKPHQAA